MKIYHGSSVHVRVPIILTDALPLDFGRGFYTTTSLDQAVKWAGRVSFRNSSGRKILNTYEFDIEQARQNLNILMFAKVNEEWLDYSCLNRRGDNPREQHDVVIEPVADDQVYRVVINYENGILDKDEAIKRLKAERLCDQILFATQKALQYLRFVKSEEV